MRTSERRYRSEGSTLTLFRNGVAGYTATTLPPRIPPPAPARLGPNAFSIVTGPFCLRESIKRDLDLPSLACDSRLQITSVSKTRRQQGEAYEGLCVADTECS